MILPTVPSMPGFVISLNPSAPRPDKLGILLAERVDGPREVDLSRRHQYHPTFCVLVVILILRVLGSCASWEPAVLTLILLALRER